MSVLPDMGLPNIMSEAEYEALPAGVARRIEVVHESAPLSLHTGVLGHVGTCGFHYAPQFLTCASTRLARPR